MPADLLPLFLGTAWACLGLSGLRLARLEGGGVGWTRLCIAGLSGAILEWYALYERAFLDHQPNDLIGSSVALISFLALVEFARRVVAQRFHLKAWVQTLGGLVVTAAAMFAVASVPGGIYDRLVFAQRSVGLPLAGLSLLAIVPGGMIGAPWARAAGIALLAGLGAAFAIPSEWLLFAGLGGAAILLRIVYVVRHRDDARPYAAWTALEFASVAALLAIAALSAQQRGEKTMELEARQLLSVTQAAAAAFDPQNVAALTGTRADEDQAAYLLVKRRLLTIQKIARAATDAQRGSRFAYLMALRGDGVIFLADQPNDPINPVAPGDAYPEASEELLRSLVDGNPFVEGPLPDRYGVWVSAFAPVRDTSGRLLAMLGIDFDAGDWAKIEESARLASILNWTFITVITLSIFSSLGLGLEARQQLRQSEQMFRIAADYTATWEYWVGPDGNMRHTSPACEKITGYKPAAFLHHPRRLLKIAHPDDRARLAEHLRTCRHDAPACEFDFKIVRKDGSIGWLSHACQSVYDTQGRWNGRRASNRDITSLRQAELTLARQERLQRGCQQGLRRLLGREGAAYVKDALEIAGQAGDCSCVTLMRLEPDQSLSPVETWPPDRETACPVPWESLRERALPILSVGETFELLPRETRHDSGPMQGAHLAILPLLDAGKLRGIVAFAAPPTRGPWSRAELATLATLASGLSVALARA